jgi:hypothetical protein
MSDWVVIREREDGKSEKMVDAGEMRMLRR